MLRTVELGLPYMDVQRSHSMDYKDVRVQKLGYQINPRGHTTSYTPAWLSDIGHKFNGSRPKLLAFNYSTLSIRKKKSGGHLQFRDTVSRKRLTIITCKPETPECIIWECVDDRSYIVSFVSCLMPNTNLKGHIAIV